MIRKTWAGKVECAGSCGPGARYSWSSIRDGFEKPILFRQRGFVPQTAVSPLKHSTHCDFDEPFPSLAKVTFGLYNDGMFSSLLGALVGLMSILGMNPETHSIGVQFLETTTSERDVVVVKRV